MKVTLREVKVGYSAIKKLAVSEYKKGNYDKSLGYIDKAVTIASQIMWRYADDELEDLLIKISSKLVFNKKEDFKPEKNRVVFYDCFSTTYILSLQYLNALTYTGCEILYLQEERNYKHTKISPVIESIKNNPNITIQIVSKTENRIDRYLNIYKLITDFSPSNIFLHIDTLAACIPVLYNLPVSIKKYYINLGDHAFWLGKKGIDYSFEFRNFGASVSYQKRGLKLNQIILLPYYPVVTGHKFMGFPLATTNKVVIFSGGDFFKMVDKHNTYWRLVSDILKENPKCVIFYANKVVNTEGENFLKNFISTNNFEDRFIPLGFRPDINEVMKHCDIFLGTCPMSGGLMSQYAAYNKKPVLQYYPEQLISFEETESMICFHNQIKISFTDKKAFLNEARQLIENADYRIEKGKQLKLSMITENDFNTLFKKSFESNCTQVEIILDDKINYHAIENWWLDVNNKGYYDVGRYIISILSLKKCMKILPRIVIVHFFNRFLKNKLFKKIVTKKIKINL